MKREKYQIGKWFFHRATSILLAVILAFSVNSLPLAFAGEETVYADKLQTEFLYDPIGIDVAKPRLSWNVLSDVRGQLQTAYQIIVSTNQQSIKDGQGEVWNSGKIESNQNSSVVYTGPELSSKTRYYWAVRVWDKDGNRSEYSEPAFFETAMLDSSDWTAKWITDGAEVSPYKSVAIEFAPVETRYVRLDATKLGVPTAGDTYRLQLAEMEIYDENGINVAINKAVTANSIVTNPTWHVEDLVDGIRGGDGSKLGFTSSNFANQNTNIWVQIDLGSVMTISKVVLFPRNDYRLSSSDGRMCNFPIDFTIKTATDTAMFNTQYTVKDMPTPTYPDSATGLPIFAKSFSVSGEIKKARAYASGLGLFEMNINGQKATDAFFEPGETNFDKTAFYVTYDITDKLVQGENAIGVYIGKGFYYNPPSPKYNRSPKIWGPLMLLAQIEIEYADGHKQVINTDESWKLSTGPIIESCWLGGEDYDARKEKDGFDRPGYDYSGWTNASIQNELPFKKLIAKMYPSLKVVEEIQKQPVITNPLSGRYVVDFSMNFAGTFSFTASFPAGTTVQFWPGETLNANGTVSQGSTGSPIYDTYTFKGDGVETYIPKFVYHGFRYLEIRNIPSAPTPDMFKGMIIRCDNEQVGDFNTSSPEINQVHQLITRSISDNMYNVLTDCPHREKLGWIEVNQLLFDSMANNFDISAWMQNTSNNMMDAQKDYGSIPAIVPPLTVGHNEHALRPGPDDTPNDPTWCGSHILVPWYSYLYYGNLEQLKIAYDSMDFYMDYLGSLAAKTEPKYILENKDLNRDLGDWGSFAGTSVTFVVSCTYYQLADVMSKISDLVGNTEGFEKYSQLAQGVKDAINARFLNKATQSYDTNSQTANALPVYLGIVPEEYKQGVIENLANNVRSRDYHLTSGEVGLKPALVVLSENGYADLAYKMVANKTQPSYYYFVTIGKTSLPEAWNGGASQNHCMLGHGEGWLYQYLGGIRNVGIGYDKSEIGPYIPEDLTSSDVSTATPYGKIRSAWTRDGYNLSLHAEVPVGTTSTIIIPAVSLNSITEGGKPLSEADGVVSYSISNKVASIVVGSGSYDFGSVMPEVLKLDALKALISECNNVYEPNVLKNYDEFSEKLSYAISIIDIADTQAEIDNAAADLQQAYNKLEYKTNLALKKSATAFSSVNNNTGWNIKNLTDGDRSNWMNASEQGGGYTSSSQEYVQHGTEWVQVDLGEPTLFTRVDLYPRNFAAPMYTFPSAYTLKVSNDNGATWQTIAQRTNIPLTSYQIEHISFEPVTAQLLRFEANELRSNPNDSGRYRLQMAEFEVYNDFVNETIVTPVSITSTVVSGYAANVEVALDCSMAAGKTVTVSLFDQTPVAVNENGVARIGFNATDIPDVSKETKFAPKIYVDGVQTNVDLFITVIPNDKTIWDVEVVPGEDTTQLVFNANITPKTSSGYEIIVNGRDKVSYTQIGNTIVADFVAKPDDIIHIKNVRLTDLFPSFTFTFTVEYGKLHMEQ